MIVGLKSRPLWLRSGVPAHPDGQCAPRTFAEFGIVAPQGAARPDQLVAAVVALGIDLPEVIRNLARLLNQMPSREKITVLDRSIRRRAPQDHQVARLITYLELERSVLQPFKCSRRPLRAAEADPNLQPESD